eukprot:gene14571-17225_t
MSYIRPAKLEAVVLDWAGTIVDFGSFAPTSVFLAAFQEIGVPITIEEARAPMGRGKWDHIKMILENEEVAKRYSDRMGHVPVDGDVDALYERFMPLQLETISKYSDPIEGAVEALSYMRSVGMAIGSCSGYPQCVMDVLVMEAKKKGIQVDHVVASDSVAHGRPLPAQALANVIALGVQDVQACVKVDDTVPGILEGRRAGMWTVALLLSGNFLGMDYPSFMALDKDQKDKERERIAKEFNQSSPHYMIDTIADLPNIIDQINKRLANGESPFTNQ